MSEQQADSGDAMRSGHWDMYKPDGSPEDRLDALLGALGAYGGDEGWQVHQLQRWLDSPASRPAPPTLVKQVKEFLRTHGG